VRAGYKVRLHCEDCSWEDPQGCFGGETELMLPIFATREEAEDAGIEATTDCGPWDYTVEECGNPNPEAAS